MGRMRAYQRANAHAGRDGGNAAGAHVAGYAAAGGQGGEEEGDVVEGCLGAISWLRL